MDKFKKLQLPSNLMAKYDSLKIQFKQKYGIELFDEDIKEYNVMVGKKLTGGAIFVAFGAIILIFIVIGIIIGELPADKYSFVPFGVVAVLVIANANGLTKKQQSLEQEFVNYLNKKRGIIPSEPIVNPNPPINTSYPISTGNIKMPVAAVNCPICQQLIPMNSNPCPKCGSPLLWE